MLPLTMRLHDLINEIQLLGTNTPRKAAFDIFNILENNQTLFVDCIDTYTFNQILKTFEKLAYAGSNEFNTANYKDDFQKVYNLLSFYLNKVI